MQRHNVKITITSTIFADDADDAKEVVKDAFLFPPAHLLDVEVAEVIIRETNLKSMY